MKDLVLNFMLRAVFGAIAIYACNTLFTDGLGMAIHLGLNAINLLTIGILGISGFGLVFSISLFSLL